MAFIDSALWFHLTIKWGSYLVFPFFVCIYWVWKKHHRVLVVFLLILSILFIYSRFIEPQLLVTRYHTIDLDRYVGEEPLRIAVVADPHLGVYKDNDLLVRAVARINQEEPDLVLLPGDFIYYHPKETLAASLQVFDQLTAPAFVVSGNHDVDPIHDIESSEVLSLLEKVGITVIENAQSIIEVNNTSIHLAGIGDIWNQADDVTIVNQYPDEGLRLLLAHNPDTIFRLPHTNIDLMVSGHTHGGQIRIPFVYKYTIPTVGAFDYGIHEERGVPIFVTSGIGEVGLPMRLGRIPRVDMLIIE